MQVIQEETEKFIKSKGIDQFCGRLILWDVGDHQDRLIILATDYCQARLNLSKPNEPKPHLPPAQDPEKLSRSVAAINKTIELYDLGYGSSKDPGYLCGRLIRWDVGTFQENLIRLETAYFHPQYNLSPQVELKPYVPPVRVPREPGSPSPLKPKQ